MTIDDFDVLVATEEHTRFAQAICDEMAESAKARGTGIAKRTADYVSRKMREGEGRNRFPQGRDLGRVQLHRVVGTRRVCGQLGSDHQSEVPQAGACLKAIKTKTFFLSLKKFPGSKLFGLTTGLAVMKINSELGYRPSPIRS